MKVTTGLILFSTLFALAWAGACSSAGDKATSPAALPADVETLRASLAPFSSLGRAKSAGYNTAITDCMSNGDIGAMGVHFGDVTLFDDVVDPLRPEVLIYEPGTNGEMSLVGVEFIVPFSEVPRTSPAPMLFGQKFLVDDAFGLWGLHVWTHRANPSGLFAPWNPRVHC
ncbi:MAG TPA: hypothetical protein VKA84_11275 [Gemmatimonadaceae bacterium]|nr:hypothetical protein [Gemmatimonadaceae bacterium]